MTQALHRAHKGGNRSLTRTRGWPGSGTTTVTTTTTVPTPANNPTTTPTTDGP